MKYIQSEDILTMDEIRGFKPSMDSMSGTIEWNNGDDMGKYLYATPNREGEGQCPVTVSYTHTRAHETRHAIECSLLIGKIRSSMSSSITSRSNKIVVTLQ